MYTIDDIDVFIKTHNRSLFLIETIECLLHQTVSPKTITVLDNDSEDNTQEIVERYKKQGVKYIKTKGKIGNFLKAKELASKKFVVLCHDDNLIHPQYFERILFGLNSINNLSKSLLIFIFSLSFIKSMLDVPPEIASLFIVFN